MKKDLQKDLEKLALEMPKLKESDKCNFFDGKEILKPGEPEAGKRTAPDTGDIAPEWEGPVGLWIWNGSGYWDGNGYVENPDMYWDGGYTGSSGEWHDLEGGSFSQGLAGQEAEREYEMMAANGEWPGGFVNAIYHPSDEELRSGAHINYMGTGDKISSEAKQILQTAIKYKENIKITSTTRTPYQQAVVMYDNIMRDGLASQMALYREPGKEVLREYQPNLSREENIRRMEAKIWAVGPQKVSKHCADPNEVEVFDISTSNMRNVNGAYRAIKAALTSAGRGDVINESSSNGCLHVEILKR